MFYEHQDCVIDHWHENEDGTGSLRSVLCKKCNSLEGRIKKDMENDKSYKELVNIYGESILEKIDIYYIQYGGIMRMDDRPL